jgi:hypothetical protein
LQAEEAALPEALQALRAWVRYYTQTFGPFTAMLDTNNLNSGDKKTKGAALVF